MGRDWDFTGDIFVCLNASLVCSVTHLFTPVPSASSPSNTFLTRASFHSSSFPPFISFYELFFGCWGTLYFERGYQEVAQSGLELAL